MEHRQSTVQLYYVFKSFVIMFLIQAVIVLFMPMALTAPIWYQVLAVNLAVALVLGWYLYKQWYHIEFTYDESGFHLRKGKNLRLSRKWVEFSRVSLARIEYNEFSVRLYENGTFVEIPVSKLKLDPFQFRLDVMNLVAMKKPSRDQPSTL